MYSNRNIREVGKMQIQIQDNTHTVVFMLNNSVAAESLYNHLPFKMMVENYREQRKNILSANKNEYR